jgi:XapX domain-containing protein
MGSMNFKNLYSVLLLTNWKEAALAFVAGAILGFIFVKLRLPVPAPAVLAGIIGVIGIWFGATLAK